MKKVFTSSSDVIHLFAQKSQSEARCSNVYFDYWDKIYSYGSHYLLGHFLDEQTIMINDEGYSPTTSKHIHQIRYATSQYRQFFTSETDIEQVHYTIIWNKNKLARANKPELYIDPILSLWKTLNEFLEWNKTKKYKSNPKYKEIKKIVKLLNENSEDFKDKLKEFQNKKAKTEKRKNAKKLKIALEDFYSYKINSFRIGDEDFLRLSKNGTKVETSQQVSVESSSAKLLYLSILKGVNLKGVYIENYEITSINGTLKIGCHNINLKSIHEIGKKL